MALVPISEIWKDSEIERLAKILEKGSVNYREPEKFVPSYHLREEFSKHAKVDLFKSKNLSPEILPTESTIILGNPLAGKTLLPHSKLLRELQSF